GMDFLLVAAKDWNEALAIYLRSGQAGQVANGGEQISQVALRGASLAGRNAGAGDDERHVDRVLIHILLADEPMAANRQAMVSREDDNRVVALAALSQRAENAANLLVHVRDDGVIARQLLLHIVRGPREWQQQLVAAANIAMIEWMLGPKIRRQRDFGRIVFRFVPRWPYPRIMRR